MNGLAMRPVVLTSTGGGTPVGSLPNQCIIEGSRDIDRSEVMRREQS
jgi:hypothetical protein